MVFSASIAFLVLAVLLVSRNRRKLESPLRAEDYWRIGFAAGPIPVYLLLPLAPFDPDLAHALLSQPFQMLLAAAAGVMWTVQDVKLISERATGK